MEREKNVISRHTGGGTTTQQNRLPTASSSYFWGRVDKNRITHPATGPT